MIATAAAFALLYLLAIPLQPYPFDVIAKTLPCLCLMVACQQRLTGRTRNMMMAATLLSALADAAIEFEFLAGLAIFLLVQIIYTVTFVQNRRPWRERPALLALTALFLLGALTLLAPKAGALAPAVIVYMIAIAGMVASAVVYRGSPYVIAGAISFLISDALIGINRFWVPVPLEEYAIMGSYYAAQLMICVGVLRSEGDGRAG